MSKQRPNRPFLKSVAATVAVTGAALLLLLPAASGNSGNAVASLSARASGASGTVHALNTVHALQSFTLTNQKVAHWAVVRKQITARSAPSSSASAVTTLDTTTLDGTQNIVLVLGAVDLSSHATWYHVRLPILPNNSTGWVPRSALGKLYIVHTHLYVDRATQTAVLKRNGVTIFKTIVGVGRTYWPTPPGQFYIRDKLTDFNDPFYGPVAFGTSARTAVLTDWPDGGFIGVHGTDNPTILPGHVSHGCIRMPNTSILKLSALMPVGTPLTIT